LLRDVLAEWADVRSGWGDPEGANALYSEALGRPGASGRSAPSKAPVSSRRRQPPS
jgi:hypothetical protein